MKSFVVHMKQNKLRMLKPHSFFLCFSFVVFHFNQDIMWQKERHGTILLTGSWCSKCFLSNFKQLKKQIWTNMMNRIACARFISLHFLLLQRAPWIAQQDCRCNLPKQTRTSSSCLKVNCNHYNSKFVIDKPQKPQTAFYHHHQTPAPFYPLLNICRSPTSYRKFQSWLFHFCTSIILSLCPPRGLF